MTTAPRDHLSAAEARRLVLHAQGVLGAPPRGQPHQRVAATLGTLGAVQLDTISVLARSHELVAYARLGPVGRAAVERAYWGGGAFEYWAHAACILPLESWPWFELKRRRYRGRFMDFAEQRTDPAVRAEALARVREAGPLTATDLGGARKGGPWWDWSPLKIAVEQLLAEGEVVCTTRRGWRRVYDLAERVVPAELRAVAMSDEECAARLCTEAALRLGAGTAADVADYFRLRPDQARMGIPAAGLVPVRVEGWAQVAYLHPDLLPLLGAPPRGRHRTTLLSPFDSLVWHRGRTQRVFDFAHLFEAYIPAPKRRFGYFTMPLLSRGALRGQVDPARSGRTLVARRVAVEKGAVEDMAAALLEAALWVGCDSVVVDAVDPSGLHGSLQAALARVA